MKRKVIILLMLLLTSIVNASNLKLDGWNLMSVCQDINASSIDMSEISQIQSQDGKFLFGGELAQYSSLKKLEAGYGYWVKGNIGTSFDSGTVTGKVEVPLKLDGWNLMGICEDIDSSVFNMTDFSQIQSQDGKFLFGGELAGYSSLKQLEMGYGYWVKGDKDASFLAKKGVSLPSGYEFEVIDNLGNEVESNYSNYLVKLYSNYSASANQQGKSKPIIISINGEKSSTLAVHEDYKNHNIVIAVYDTNAKLVSVSDIFLIQDNDDIQSLSMTFNENENVINTPPTLTPILDATMMEGDSTLQLSLNATDADGDTITFDANSSDTSSVTTSITGNILTLTRLTNDGGTYTITVSASDGNASDVKSFTLTVPTIVTDTENPVVTLNGSSEINITVGNSYNELGATVTDNVDTGLIAVITGTVDTNTIGSYTLTYTATDSAGNVGTATRRVNVIASDDNNNNGQLPNGFTYEVINNLGESIVIDGDYGVVKLYANYAEVADDQKNHVGISVKLDGNSIPTAQIQNSYRGHEIVAVLYNISGKLLAVSNPTVVDTSSPVTVIDLNSSGNGGNNNPISKEMMNTFAGKTFYDSYINENNVGIIEEIIFDTNLSSLTWEQIRGDSDSGRDIIRVEGNRLYIEDEYHEYIKQVDNYLLMHDYEKDSNGSWVQNDTSRLYFNFNDAESYLSTLIGEPVVLPEGFTYRVINNLGEELESTITLDGHNFTVKLFSQDNITANDQVNHVGVFVNVNGQNSTFQIQNSYTNVVVAVYDETSKLVAVSDVTAIDGNTGISINF